MFIVDKTPSGNYKIGLYESDASAIPATINEGQLMYLVYVFHQYKANKLPDDFNFPFVDIYNNTVVLKRTSTNKLLFGVIVDYADFTLNVATLDGLLINEILERIKKL